MKSPEIIEAVPQSKQQESKNRMKLLWVTNACMASNAGLFFINMGSPQAGELLLLWEGSLVFGMASVYLNLLRKEKLINEVASAKTTYTVVPSRGRNRFFKWLLPGK